MPIKFSLPFFNSLFFNYVNKGWFKASGTSNIVWTFLPWSKSLSSTMLLLMACFSYEILKIGWLFNIKIETNDSWEGELVSTLFKMLQRVFLFMYLFDDFFFL